MVTKQQIKIDHCLIRRERVTYYFSVYTVLEKISLMWQLATLWSGGNRAEPWGNPRPSAGCCQTHVHNASNVTVVHMYLLTAHFGGQVDLKAQDYELCKYLDLNERLLRESVVNKCDYPSVPLGCSCYAFHRLNVWSQGLSGSFCFLSVTLFWQPPLTASPALWPALWCSPCLGTWRIFRKKAWRMWQ